MARLPIVRAARVSRSPSPTPATSTTPSPSPTVVPTPGFTVVVLRAVSWQWDFYGPNASLGPPYPGFNTITLKKGKPYELHIYNGGPVPDPGVAPHVFSGIPALGLSAGVLVSLDGGGTELVQQFTPQVTGGFFFNCGDTNCSTGDIERQHDQMNGYIIVVP